MTYKNSMQKMNKELISIKEDGHRTRGVLKFYKELGKDIIPLQKSIPPYMPYVGGYGYLGLTLLDITTDRIQCHLCGYWYKALAGHLKVHNLTATEYKKEVGLFKSESLCSLKTLYKFRVKNRGQENAKLGHQFKKGHKLGVGDINGTNRIQWKNRYGTCDAQLKFRLDKEIEKYGRLPPNKECSPLWRAFHRRFGS